MAYELHDFGARNSSSACLEAVQPSTRGVSETIRNLPLRCNPPLDPWIPHVRQQPMQQERALGMGHVVLIAQPPYKATSANLPWSKRSPTRAEPPG